MQNYQLEYISTNKYEEVVKDAYYQLMVLPEHTENQFVDSFSLLLSVPSTWWKTKNNFGGELLLIKPKHPFNEFEIKLTTYVKLEKEFIFPASVLSPEEEATYFDDPNRNVDFRWFLQPTKLTQVHNAILKTLPKYTAKETLVDYLINLRKALHVHMTFESGITHVHTTAYDAWKDRKGVCQDYAHIFSAVARYYGIPSRYVAGYLSQGKDFRGNTHLHAWVECYIPELGWVGIDPSNDLMVDIHYIKICHGRDYSDCSPIKGILNTKGDHETLHKVKVQQMSEQQ